MNLFPSASRTLATAAVVAALCACTPAPTRTGAPRTFLRGADCLDPAQARGWHDLSSSELVVDAGRRRYRIVVPPQCLRTAGSGPLRFEGDPITGRVCGFPGDAVLLRDARCPIQSMQVLAEGDDGSAPP